MLCLSVLRINTYMANDQMLWSLSNQIPTFYEHKYPAAEVTLFKNTFYTFQIDLNLATENIKDGGYDYV